MFWIMLWMCVGLGAWIAGLLDICESGELSPITTKKMLLLLLSLIFCMASGPIAILVVVITSRTR